MLDALVVAVVDQDAAAHIDTPSTVDVDVLADADVLLVVDL